MSIRASSLGLWMAAVTALAVELAAFRAGTALAATVVYNVTALVLLAAAVKARYARGAAGAWWFGFALFGWAGWLLTLGSEILGDIATPARWVADLVFRELYKFSTDPEGEPLKLIVRPTYSRKLILESVLSLVFAPPCAWIVRLYVSWRKPGEDV